MKLFRAKDTKKTEQEKVEERREEVLARGRQFKYPLQWTKHRVVVNTILIATIVLAILAVSGWLALYQFGMTDDMLYRVTKITNIPVAVVDGENVLFSDYLMFYRSSITSIERQSSQGEEPQGFDDLRREYKESALKESEEYTYALKLLKELDLEVTNEDVAAEFARHLKIGGVKRSEASFMKIVEENFGLDKSEYDRMLYLTLAKAKVEAAIDEKATKTADQVESLLKTHDGDYEKVAEELGDAIEYQETGGYVSNQNIDGGRASEAFKLEPGQESGRFISLNGDGYYFVKLIKKTDTEVNFVSIKVPFTEFASRMNNLREEGKITRFVTITDNK